MCGINGFNFKNVEKIDAMNTCLAHRGPDSNNSYSSNEITLGHTRLSIIDLSEMGNQPMEYSKNGKNIKIVFNGEIYNYLEIRKELKTLGYIFHSESDTEVILASYMEWGENCVNRFNGMWAFCLVDFEKNILFCSRDRLGVKPFLYYIENEKFIFSSELKSILVHNKLKINTIQNINPEALHFFFSQGFIPAPQTIFKNVFKLKASFNLIYDLGKKEITKLYRYYLPLGNNYLFDKKILIKEGTELLNDAVKLRMRSDVPVGAFLSGGLDSSAVVGVMKDFTELSKLHTFSIGFEEKKYDETYYINLVKNKFKTIHHHYYYLEKDFNQLWESYSTIYDEPFGDYSSFPSYQVSKMANEYVTVALSGDGGDEIFGGYPIYNIGYLVERLRHLNIKTRESILAILKKSPKSPLINKFIYAFTISLAPKNNFYSLLHESEKFNSTIYNKWTEQKLTEYLALCENNLAEALRLFDLYDNTLPDKYLTKVDKASMANSLEVRSPFLDYRFVEFAQKIPQNWKVNWKDTKILLREIIKDIVPHQIVNRGKMGFTPPINHWLYSQFSNDDFKRFNQYLVDLNELSLSSFYQSILNNEFKPHNRDFYLIKLAIFGKWFEKWIL